MKTAQCNYTQAGAEINLHIYFDPKTFDFFTPPLTDEQAEDVMRLACDSIAAALPREKAEKHFYIKRLFQSSDSQHLILLCTDGFLIDVGLTLPVSQQAYSKERVKIAEMDQLPTRLKLSNDLISNINNKLPVFEEIAKKDMTFIKGTDIREPAVLAETQAMTQEFRPDKAFEVIAEISRLKKEIRELAENNIQAIDSLLTGKKEKMLDPVAKEIKHNLQEIPAEKYKELLIQKMTEMTPVAEKFSDETDEIVKRITEKTQKQTAFKHLVIHALYEAARQFHELQLQKFHAAPLHMKKSMMADFNKKFSGIASLNESGELSHEQDTKNDLEKLSLNNLQEIISNDDRKNPGLLQKCNTSWTEESPELQIVMQQLSQLKKTLSALFANEPPYATREMMEITRTPFPRSFQFRFSENALGYNKMVDDFCKDQKDMLAGLVNQYKKILQVSDIHDKTLTSRIWEEPINLQKYKEISDTILSLAGKDTLEIETLGTAADELFQSIRKNMEPHSTSLLKKLNSLIGQIRENTNNAAIIMQELSGIKSQVDININHFILHPEKTPDLIDLDQKIKLMTEKRALLLAKKRMLHDTKQQLATYDNMIRRINEIDFSVTKTEVMKHRNEAKEFLLQFLKKENSDPASTQSFRKNILDQYGKIDMNASDIDKMLTELASIKNTLLTDLEKQTDLSRLEIQFHAITEKMESLAKELVIMSQNVSGLKEAIVAGR